MRRNSYKQLDQDSQYSGSLIDRDVEFSGEISTQFARPKHRDTEDQLDKQMKARHQVQKQKLTNVRSIYMNNFTQATKNKKSDVRKKEKEEKINTDQLIKVLQNGKQRRNLRKKKNEEENQEGERIFNEPDLLINQRSQHSSQISVENPREKKLDQEIATQPKKIINEIKKDTQETKKSNSSIKQQEEQWKEIESLLAAKTSHLDSPKKQAQKNERRNQLEAAKQLLSGKVSIIWIFVVSQILDQNLVTRIKKMYSGLSERQYLVPLCKNDSEAAQFLTVPNSLFKIVSDLENISRVLQFKINPKVVQFYIYNEEGQKGISKALCFKAQSRKVKGIYNNLQRIIDRAEEEIENEIQMFMAKNGISTKKTVKKFPSFLRLSGEDKTQATLYRANLYGACKISQEEKKSAYADFMSLVVEKYGSEPREKQNIIDYGKIRHFNQQLQLSDAKQIVQFYVRQSFYYQILNSMLRTMKTTEQFKTCILPFYENYHAVKMFYMNDLVENNRVIPAQTLYRGTKLRLRDFKALIPNTYIEMFGFMSTSKNFERAKQFTSRDGYMFVIHVPEITIPKKFDKYDHGFVDINKHKLALNGFQVEQQVLFNSLNIYKVLKIQQSKEGFRMIHIEYGSIFSLLSKDKQKLTSDERDVLVNYQFCANLIESIEDQGDVLLLANEFQESKEYYNDKIKNDESNGKYYYKLANVQQQCGELLEADKNVKKSLEIQLEDLNISDREKCLKVFSIHSKNAEISLDKEDYLDADQAITNALELLTQDQTFERAKKIRERGQIKFKKGEIKNAEKDFEESERLFKSLTQKAEEEKKKINRGYVFSFMTLLCSSETQEQLEEDRANKLKQIAEVEKQIKDMNDLINDELIRVNGSLKEVAIYAEDKEKYEICVKKARAYLFEVKSRETNDPREKAKLKALQATIQDYLSLAQSEILLQQAIQLVESQQPFDPTVGKYANILADIQKKQLQKSSAKGLQKVELTKGMEPIKYNETQQKNIYSKCKKNYEKALNVLLYNNKNNASPEVLSVKNQIGELDFNQSNYVNSEKIIKEVKEASLQNQHSQVSKSCLLLSKISYARGQLKDAFDNVKQSDEILQKALIKKKQQVKYQRIYESHEIYRELVVHRSKIYMKQMNHDLAIRDLFNLESILERKEQQDTECRSIIADIYELQAENVLVTNPDEDFQKYFEKAIKLREKQMGSLNLPNAVCYCNYAKYMILAGQLKEAEKLIEKALQIFACFSDDHPITWLVLYCSGIFNEKQNKMTESIRNLEKCILMARRKFDRDHITINKVRYQLAKILHKAGRYEQAIQEFQTLQHDLEQGLTASQGRHPIINEKDDEKVTIKRSLYNSLKDSYKEMNKLDESGMMNSSLGILRIEQKMEDLRQTFNLDKYEKEEE